MMLFAQDIGESGLFHMEVLMRAGISEALVGDSVGHDFLFTWKSEHWPHDDLRKLVEAFRSNGTAEELWTCATFRKIHPGDRAYLLKQGKPIGIFGRGTIVDEPKPKSKPIPGRGRWEVLIRFEASRGDVLWDPKDKFLVDGSQLPPARKDLWKTRNSGIPLEPKTARGIDSMILDSILIGHGQTTSVDELAQEVARTNKLIEQWIRPDQQLFSEAIRKNYRDRCAVTGCVTRAALEAAHISTQKGLDNNSPANGILLRSDIHALFDRLLITLSEDGRRVEVSPELTDPSYVHLKTAMVARSDGGPPPSAENIRQHRNRFFERRQRHFGDSGKQILTADL
jgi:hypothetical protein